MRHSADLQAVLDVMCRLGSLILLCLLLALPLRPLETGGMGSEMQDLIQIAKDTPAELGSSNLAKVFVHLMEFPEDDFRSSDLIAELVKREPCESYEILRAMTLYYSNPNGDLFYVGEGDDYNKKYLRAVQYVTRALEARGRSYDERLERFGEFEDSYLERNYGTDFFDGEGGPVRIKRRLDIDVKGQGEALKKAIRERAVERP